MSVTCIYHVTRTHKKAEGLHSSATTTNATRMTPLTDSTARYLMGANYAFSWPSMHVRLRAHPHDDMDSSQEVVVEGHVHDLGHVQGHGVTDVGGHVVEVAAGRNDDIIVIVVVVAATRDGAAAVAASHRGTVAVPQNTTTAMDTPRNSREVAANQHMRTIAQQETTSHHREIMRAMLIGARVMRMNDKEVMTVIRMIIMQPSDCQLDVYVTLALTWSLGRTLSLFIS